MEFYQLVHKLIYCKQILYSFEGYETMALGHGDTQWQGKTLMHLDYV